MLSLLTLLTFQKSINWNSVSIIGNCWVSAMHIYIHLSRVSLSLQTWIWVQNLAFAFFYTRNLPLKNDTMVTFMTLYWSLLSPVSAQLTLFGSECQGGYLQTTKALLLTTHLHCCCEVKKYRPITIRNTYASKNPPLGDLSF